MACPVWLRIVNLKIVSVLSTFKPKVMLFWISSKLSGIQNIVNTELNDFGNNLFEKIKYLFKEFQVIRSLKN